MTVLSADGSGVRLQVRVQPNASRTRIMGPHGDFLRIALMAPPVDGKANAALVAFLAERLGVKKSQVRILSGETSREKSLRLEGVTVAAVAACLEGLG